MKIQVGGNSGKGFCGLEPRRKGRRGTGANTVKTLGDLENGKRCIGVNKYVNSANKEGLCRKRVSGVGHHGGNAGKKRCLTKELNKQGGTLGDGDRERGKSRRQMRD